MRGASPVAEPTPKIWTSPVLRMLPDLLMASGSPLIPVPWDFVNFSSPWLCVFPLISLRPSLDVSALVSPPGRKAIFPLLMPPPYLQAPRQSICLHLSLG